MLHYKDPTTGIVYAYETEADREQWGAEGLVAMSDAETATHHEANRPRADPREIARAYLADTDWYVMRQLETGTPIPGDVGAARAAARETLSS